MKRIKGQEVIETAEAGYSDIYDLQHLKRQVDAGYRRFLARRGLPMPFGMKAEVNAGFSAAGTQFYGPKEPCDLIAHRKRKTE